VSQGYDVIVVGSGFGGAVMACRLAEAGARVLMLERGRRWLKEQYPRSLTLG
jgi:cholesterol oxidase